VVVVHDGARLLPGLVSGVREQTHAVHRVIGVDTGSLDRSGATLSSLIGPDVVFGMDPDTGYGAAVARALQHPAARRPGAAPGAGPEPAVEWIWLLHDDCEPAADALEQMLRVASRSRSTAVLGPKLKDLADRRVLREAGVTVDRAGRRLTGIEPGELDQGQHDGNRKVLAVSSAGMLIRRDVWDQLGGFDTSLALFRDDIDFCWRVHAAGYEVRVVTDAVVYHRDLSARQIRKATAGGGHLRLLDRRGTLYVFAVNLPFGAMLTVVAGCLTGSLARAGYFLVTKQQRKALAHLGAIAWLLRHPLLIRQARRRRAADRRTGWAVLRDQVPRGKTLGRMAETVAGVLSRNPAYESGGLHHALIDEPGDEMLLPDTPSVARRVLTSPGVLLVTGLAVVALVAERSLTGSVLTGSGTLAGGALVPAWGGAGDLWREYLAGFHTAGLGSAASAPPYLAVVAALATLLAGKAWLAVDVLLFGCVPAAGLTAFLAARRLTSRLAARIWIAVTYAVLPVAMGAVAAGRIGTAVAFVLLPLIGITIGRMLGGPRRRARRAAWAAGLLIAVAAAFVPLIWPLAVAAALVAACAWPWLGRATVINAAIAAVVPAVLLIPWTFHLVTSPAAFFLEAGLQQPGLAAAGLRPESLFLLSPGGPGLPPAWVTAGLVGPAFVALLLRRRTVLVRAGWGIALSGLAVTLAVSRLRITPPQGGPAVSPWPGLTIAIAAAGLLLAATPLVEAAVQALGRRAGTANWRALAVLGGLVVASAPVLAAGYWLVNGVRGPVTAAAPQILPAFVAATSSGPAQNRTLVLRQNDGVLAYSVLRASDPILGEPELPESAPATRALNSVVAALSSPAGGDGGDAGQALSQFDIGYVLLPAPVDQLLARQLDGAAGLIPLTVSASYDLWKVGESVARVQVIGAGGTAVPVPSDPVGTNTVIGAATSGTLMLAEPAGGWSATLNGTPLARKAAPVGGWAQGFVLPAGGGRLVITRNNTARHLSLAGEAVALLVVFALALPGTRAPAPAPAAAEDEAGPDTDAAPAPGRRRERTSRPRLTRSRPQPQVPGPGISGPEIPVPEVSVPVPVGAPARPDLRPDPGQWVTPDDHAVFATAGPTPAPYPAAGPTPAPYPAAATGGSDPASAPYPTAGPDPAPDTAPGPARRSRGGGQHAARHGKPSRRQRGNQPAQAAAEAAPPSAMADGVSLETLDLVTADTAADDLPPDGPDRAADWSRPPWETGDRP
jgi:GT2 family glycosyltransferase